MGIGVQNPKWTVLLILSSKRKKWMNNLNLVVSRFGEEIFQYGFLKVEQWVGESWEQFRAKSLLVFLYRLFYFLLTLSLLMEVADFFFSWWSIFKFKSDYFWKFSSGSQSLWEWKLKTLHWLAGPIRIFLHPHSHYLLDLVHSPAHSPEACWPTCYSSSTSGVYLPQGLLPGTFSPPPPYSTS